jgi:hypothetical protein
MDAIPNGCGLTGCAMTAEIISEALGGRKVGAGWMTRCAAHDDRNPSFSVRVIARSRLVVCYLACCTQAMAIGVLREPGRWPTPDECRHFGDGDLDLWGGY